MGQMSLPQASCRASLPDDPEPASLAVELRGIEYLIAGEDAPGLPILFLHGLGGDASNWQPQLDELGALHRCIAWTMPGYGTSAPLIQPSFVALAAAAVDLLDGLGCETACVVGLSLGGYVAQQLVLDHPDRVERLVLCATTSAFGKPGSSFNEEFLASRLAPLDLGETPATMASQVVRDLVGPAPHGGAELNAVASMQRITPDAYRQALKTLVTWDARDAVASIATRTLCIAGADDATAPVRAMQRLADAIPNATLEVLVDCGHLLNLERPREFNHILRAFLGVSS